MTQYITTLFTTHPPAHPPVQLVIEVVQQLQRMFLPDVKIIKKSIENLIDVSRAGQNGPLCCACQTVATCGSWSGCQLLHAS